ncbi:hypothetical protein EON63_10140 [archaeon]|nr:MAG: hypothetical protein EON63_10140 [archaeon]
MFNFTGGSKRKENQGSSERRLLHVELVEARQLLALVKNGTSDPVVQLALTDLGGREIKKEIFRSKQKSGTLSPSWDEKFTFGRSFGCKSSSHNFFLLHKPYHAPYHPYTILHILSIMYATYYTPCHPYIIMHPYPYPYPYPYSHPC